MPSPAQPSHSNKYSLMHKRSKGTFRGRMRIKKANLARRRKYKTIKQSVTIPQSITVENFDIGRLHFEPVVKENCVTSNINYLYDSNRDLTKENLKKYGKPLVFETGPIKLVRGSIKKFVPEYDDCERKYFYIPRSDVNEESNKLFDFIDKIDKHMIQQMLPPNERYKKLID